MSQVSDDTLLLFHYGELAESEMDRLREWLATDAALAERYADLAAMLDSVPEPDAARDDFYGRRVWQAIEPRLDKTAGNATKHSWWRMTGLAAGIGLVAITAYQLGRNTAEIPTPEQAFVEAPERSDGRSRFVQASLRNHMNSASRLFLEIENAESYGVVDVEAERNWAMTLLVANRLYRLAAEQSGQARIAQVLADMEPMLIELANSDRVVSDAEFNALRQRLANSDITFKANATSRSLDERQPRGGI